MPRFFSYIFLIFGFFGSYAQLMINEKLSFESISLHNEAKYFKTDKSINIEDVRQLPIEVFESFESSNDNTGFTNSNFWVHFQIFNQSSETKIFFLETGRPITDVVDLYSFNGNDLIKTFKNGDIIPFNDKAILHRKIVFKIEIPAESMFTYYVHYKSDGEVISFPLYLRTIQNFINVTTFEQLIFGFFYGILGLTAIIYLFFFFGIKNKSFLYYGVYVISIGFMQFSLDGYFHQYFLPIGGYLSDRSVLIFAAISTIFLGKYTENFLEIKNHNKNIFLGFKTVYYAALALLGLLFFVPKSLPICYPIANTLGFLLLGLIVSGILSIYFEKKKLDLFFTIGIFFLILGFFIFILNNFNIIPNTFITLNSPKIGTGFEVIFLSLSMSNLIKNLRDERESLQEIALLKSEEMNDLKLYFLSNISHELRTPLNIILNLMDRISKNSNKRSVQVDCEIVASSTQNLLSAVNDILDFSKIEKEEFALEKEQFNLTLLIDDIFKNYQYMSDNYDLVFEFETNLYDDFLVNGDRDRLRQVLSNLLNNAMKFTPKGTIVLKVHTIEKSADDVKLVIEVSDTGIGISKQKLDVIFNSFSQESIDNKRKYGGLGLGLYIVKKIVDASNGTISIESEVDKGTVFKVVMPITKVINKKSEIVFSEISNHFLNKSVLVVEDNLLNQLVLKKILKEFEQINLTFANNGLECLDKLKSNIFDIILMDLQMPEMDGYEASISIRNGDLGEKVKNIPIIAVTADVMETTKVRVLEVGMNSYISKPIEKNLLFNEMYNLVVA